MVVSHRYHLEGLLPNGKAIVRVPTETGVGYKSQPVAFLRFVFWPNK